MILASELSEFLQKCSLDMSWRDKGKGKISQSEIESIIKEVDYRGNGRINYSEFLSATIEVDKFLTDKKLKAIFSQFDTDDSGHLTAKNIHNAMQKLGQEIDITEIEQMLSQHDIKGDQVLNYDEFECMFLDMKQIFTNPHTPQEDIGPFSGRTSLCED